MKTSVIEVRNMLSVLSVSGVEERIGAVPGVESVTANFAAGTATVRYDETRLHVSDIKSDVRQSGYEREAASAAPTALTPGAPEADKSMTTAPPAISEAPAAIPQGATPVPPAVAAASGTAAKAGAEAQPKPEPPPGARPRTCTVERRNCAAISTKASVRVEGVCVSSSAITAIDQPSRCGRSPTVMVTSTG